MHRMNDAGCSRSPRPNHERLVGVIRGRPRSDDRLRTKRTTKGETLNTDIDEPTTAEVAQGLRELADWIEAHPDNLAAQAVAHDMNKIGTGTITFNAVEFHTLASALGGERQKDVDDDYMIVTRKFGPVLVRIRGSRESVCVAKVVGTVTEELPARDAIPAQPARTVKRDIIEWECPPVLTEVAS